MSVPIFTEATVTVVAAGSAVAPSVAMPADCIGFKVQNLSSTASLLMGYGGTVGAALPAPYETIPPLCWASYPVSPGATRPLIATLLFDGTAAVAAALTYVRG